MRSLFSLLICCAVISYSCSTNPVDNATDAVKVTRTVSTDPSAPKCTAKIAVEGMSCAKACGSRIAGCLKKLEGVENTEIFFDPERKTADVATVQFDDKKITEKEMITAIEKLGDGQYKVKSIEIITSETTYQKIEEEPRKENNKPTGSKVSAVNGISLVLPGIFEILFRIISA